MLIQEPSRGLNAGLIHIGYPAALICISLLAALMLRIAPAGGADSAYALWGWRVPFVIGAALAAALFLYVYLLVPESETWQSAQKSAAPLKDLFVRAQRRRLGRLFVVMSGAWLTLNATVGALPGVIETVLGARSTGVNKGIMLGAALAAPLFPVMGMLSQRVGRRAMIIVAGFVNLVPTCALYLVLVAGGYRDPAALIFLVAPIIALSMLVWPVITPYLTESFNTEIRSSGYGVSYSLAAMLPGLYSFYMLGLAKLMPYEFTPVVLLALGALLLSVGALAGPETKHVDLYDASLAPAASQSTA